MHDETQVEAKPSGMRDAETVAIIGDRRIDLRETESRSPSERLRYEIDVQSRRPHDPVPEVA